MTKSHERLGKDRQISDLQSNRAQYEHLVEIGPVDPKLRGEYLDH